MISGEITITPKKLRFNYFQLLAFYNYDKVLVSQLYQSFLSQFPKDKKDLLIHFKNSDIKKVTKSLNKIKSFALNFQCSELVADIVEQEKIILSGKAPIEIKIYSILSKSQILLEMISAHQEQAA